MTKVSTSSKRIGWIDNAKALGILAVFYGHIVEKISLANSSEAFLQFKFIYSFHIPLFFILSGFFAKQYETSFKSYIKSKFVLRIVPVIFFTIIILPFHLINEIMIHKNFDLNTFILKLLSLLRGYPVFNFVTWFLVCLFTVEVINFFVYPCIQGNRKKLIVTIAIFYVVGWLVTWNRRYVFQVLQIGGFWFLYEALIAYSFYLFGNLIAAIDIIIKNNKPYLNITFVLISSIILFLTFDLNTGFFRGCPQKVVLMAGGLYGNPLLFPLTAIAGSIFVIFLSKLIPANNKMVTFIGRNTLILMGLNGIFYHFINEKLLILSSSYISNNSFHIFILCSLLSVMSIALCVPVVLLLNKYLSQLTGSPRSKMVDPRIETRVC